MDFANAHTYALIICARGGCLATHLETVINFIIPFVVLLRFISPPPLGHVKIHACMEMIWHCPSLHLRVNGSHKRFVSTCKYANACNNSQYAHVFYTYIDSPIHYLHALYGLGTYMCTVYGLILFTTPI